MKAGGFDTMRLRDHRNSPQKPVGKSLNLFQDFIILAFRAAGLPRTKLCPHPLPLTETKKLFKSLMI
jgi:hypothetical protein